MQIVLPSGLTGEARKIRGQEAIDLAERAASSTGNSLASVLRGCWTKTTSAGPYTHTEAGSPTVDWDRVLKGDLIRGLLVLRAGSIPSTRAPDTKDPWPGKRYDFYVQCERCRARYGWTINDVVSDLPLRALPEESAARVRSGEPFAAKVTDAGGAVHDLTFDLMLPEQDAVLRALLKQLGRKKVTPVESLAAQTRTVDGAPKSPAIRQAFFAQLDLGELYRLRDLYDAADCGVDTDLLTTCTEVECGHIQETSLPFGRTLWRPEIPPAPKQKEPEEGKEPPAGTSPGP